MISANLGLIALNAISKSYTPGKYAVHNASLVVKQGTLVALLGPSGCGKTTTLRLLAGLEQPDTGEIWLAGRCVAGTGVWVAPEERRVGMVFQDYALFPHLTVAENVAFALHRMPKPERQQRVAALLDLVELHALDRRYPHELSGGQQQRVALARALANQPAVVLLDEPFSNLDAALRLQMRNQVEKIVRAAQTTAVLVTHDQEEALSLADQVVVMFDGQIAQIGTPKEIYHTPATKQVAAFVGEANWLAAEATGNCADSLLGEIPLVQEALGAAELLIRPEMLALTPDTAGAARVASIHYYGHTQLIKVLLPNGTQMQARCAPTQDFTVGMAVRVDVQGAVMAYTRSRDAVATPSMASRTR
jgi:iron(III) transport system ATP-binding protein